MIADHLQRYQLANELHARPFPFHSAPGMVAFLALKEPENAAQRDRTKDQTNLIGLLDRFGAPHPKEDATHYFGDLGSFKLKWEAHTEFVTYTIFLSDLSQKPFDGVSFDAFPKEWLDTLSTHRITSVNLRLENMSGAENNSEIISKKLSEWFVPESLAVSKVLDGSAVVASDFRIDDEGHQRFVLFIDPATDDRRVGRIIQRLCEIEMYKSMSMLGFARVRSMARQMGDVDTELSQIMSDMNDGKLAAEVTLDNLLKVSTELETLSAEASFRLGATEAYEAIVHQRIRVLREERFKGRQTFSEFMMRRYDPAMRTVKSSRVRLGNLADRAIRAGDLLRTRVDVERSAQNQALLTSMDRRADLQLRLQKTVEGLSVVAISYYAVSLVSYLLYPLAENYSVTKGFLNSIITLPVIGFVYLTIRRIRSKML